jgi:hypothetical protein
VGQRSVLNAKKKSTIEKIAASGVLLVNAALVIYLFENFVPKDDHLELKQKVEKDHDKLLVLYERHTIWIENERRRYE